MNAHGSSWRRLLPPTIALCLLVAAGLAVAENTLVVNPYEGVDWDAVGQYKANLHTHTAAGRGAVIEPPDVIDEYNERGYRILALTDHDQNTWPWTDYGRDPTELGMLAISGNELSAGHDTNALFCHLETDETDHDAALEEIAAHNGLAFLCHPGRYWQPTEEGTVPADVLERYRGIFSRHDHLVGLEIINCGNRYSNDRLLWDALLEEMMPGRPVHAFANDDMHSIGHLGRDWTVYPLPALTEDGVRNAMTSGAFYAASVSTQPEADRSVKGTPVITRITHRERDGTLTIAANVGGEPLDDAGYRWIVDGEVVHDGPTLRYRDDDRIDNYVRAEIVGTGGTAFTNAFGFTEREGDA
ncbi:MAG: hypothetical protein ACLFU7_15075 [Armatimonadota bacterium]